MKRNYQFNILTVFALLFIFISTACQKLEEEPVGRLTPANFYKTPEQCEAAFAGSMNALFSTWNGYAGVPGFPDGQLDGASLLFSVTSNNQYWQWHYKAISNLNPVIKAIKQGSLSSYSKEVVGDIEGQAKFLRAFNYFHLVRLYGKIPYIDEDTPDVISTPLTPESRLEISAIYDKIEADLLFAAQNMYDRDASTPGKPNKWTAKALLSKVYLTRATAPLKQTDYFAKARDMADDVIKNGPYSLVPKITDVFKTSNTNNSESIFAYQSADEYPSLPGIDNGPDEWGCWGDGPVKALWAEAYPEQPRKHIYVLLNWPVDLRASQWEWINYKNSNYQIPWNGKRSWPNLTIDEQLDDGGNNHVIMPVLRLADIYLVYAEAANMAGAGPTQLAVDRLNKIITRANTPSASEHPETSVQGTEALATTAMTKTEFNQKVWDERNYELCFEFDRYFDVLRQRVLKEVNLPDNANDYDDNDYLFPIPPLDATFIGQNPGY